MRSRKFVVFAWSFVAYLLFVILFGAWVRITHSGAGCGSHWPTCHGELVPLDPSLETIIEYTHRLTSGFLGILGVVLLAWAARLKQRRVLVAAAVTLVLIVFEALIGAGLVLRELVADDDSVARAVVIALHLANTLVLTGAASLVAWWSHTDDAPDDGDHRGLFWFGIGGLALLVVTSMSGAVTALGDTLFPVDPAAGDLLTRVRGDLSSANHFLVRLRIIHPIVAVGTALYLIVVSHVVRAKEASPHARGWATALFGLVLTQTLVGIVNIGLAAPGWLQLTHLLIAQLVWIAALLTAVTSR